MREGGTEGKMAEKFIKFRDERKKCLPSENLLPIAGLSQGKFSAI